MGRPGAARRTSHARANGSRLVRRARYRRTLRALARRDRARARGLPHRPIPSPRLWQRFLIMPLMTLVQGVRSGLVWLREVCLSRPPHVLDVDPAEFLVVGHRGACAVAVENTIDSFERAIETEGANAIELDLCVTRDGEVVVWHDWDPDGTVAFARQAGAELDVLCRPVVPPEGHPLRKPVCDLTLAQLRDHYGYAPVGSDEPSGASIPLLEDVVRWAASKPTLRAIFLDCKVPPERKELIGVVAHALRRALERTPARAEFVFLTPYPEVFEALKPLVPGASRSYDVEIPPGFYPDAAPLSSVAKARAAGDGWATLGRPVFTIGGWHVFRALIESDLRSILAARGTPDAGTPSRYVCWTLNRRREMKQLLRLGVSGILTDFPKDLRTLLLRTARRPRS